MSDDPGCGVTLVIFTSLQTLGGAIGKAIGEELVKALPCQIQAEKNKGD